MRKVPRFDRAASITSSRRSSSSQEDAKKNSVLCDRASCASVHLVTLSAVTSSNLPG